MKTAMITLNFVKMTANPMAYSVEGSDQAIEGYGKYSKTDRKCFTNDVSIASVDVAVTDDGNGAETLHLNTVYASETTSDDLYSKYGYYIELSVRNREQTKDKGEMDTVRVNIGSYLIYAARRKPILAVTLPLARPVLIMN